MSEETPPTPPPPQSPQNRIPASITDEMRQSYMDYAMSVIIGRALPDVRDGLKPANRRVLYGMQQMGLQPGRPYRKSAKIVGEVMGNYHPHGDQAIYDALARLAQDFNVRYPLVDGQGNFGNIDGDNPAAQRYTEARLTAAAAALMEGLTEDAVDFRDNYDGSEQEPVVLPAAFPNLLANGSSGIAVGMATNIPPHNIDELCAACLHLIKAPAVEALDPKGAGDSFTAATVAALVSGAPMLQALGRGAAAGATNVARRGLASGRQEVVDALTELVTIDPLAEDAKELEQCES